jgi:hypothetical protein
MNTKIMKVRAKMNKTEDRAEGKAEAEKVSLEYLAKQMNSLSREIAALRAEKPQAAVYEKESRFERMRKGFSKIDFYRKMIYGAVFLGSVCSAGYQADKLAEVYHRAIGPQPVYASTATAKSAIYAGKKVIQASSSRRLAGENNLEKELKEYVESNAVAVSTQTSTDNKAVSEKSKDKTFGERLYDFSKYINANLVRKPSGEVEGGFTIAIPVDKAIDIFKKDKK